MFLFAFAAFPRPAAAKDELKNTDPEKYYILLDLKNQIVTVYERDENGKVYVAEPFLCMVGCCFCKSVCEPHALLFPTQDLLKNFREKM